MKRFLRLSEVFTLMVFIMLFASGIQPGNCLASDSLPSWALESYWDYTTTSDMHLQEEGSEEYADITLTDENTRYTLVSIETKTLTRGSMLTYSAYVLTYSGTANANGIYHTTNPVPADIPIQIRNATMAGEWWVDTATLGTIYFHRHIQGPLWAQLPFQGWQEVGSVDIDENEEYEPPKDEMNFPIDVGHQWEETITFYTYGHYVIDYDTGSGPQHDEDDFDGSETYTFQMNVPNQEESQGLMTYHIDGDETGSEGTITANYAPEARNLTYEKIKNLESSGSVRLNQMVRELTGYQLAPDPTPTPTAPPEHGISVKTNKKMYHEGDLFRCTTTIANLGPAITVDEYVVLDVYGQYWFWPGWTQDVDKKTRDLDENGIYPDEVILEFTWPEVEGSADGIVFWAAILDVETGELVGQYGYTEWGYE